MRLEGTITPPMVVRRNVKLSLLLKVLYFSYRRRHKGQKKGGLRVSRLCSFPYQRAAQRPKPLPRRSFSGHGDKTLQNVPVGWLVGVESEVRLEKAPFYMFRERAKGV